MKKTKLSKFQGLEKIVVNIGVGKLRNLQHFEEKVLPEIIQEVALITGQKAALRPAKKAIASFKTRVGDIIGLRATLRGTRMNDFLTRINNIVFPRVRDFRGVNLKNIDLDGNLNIGFREQFVFPEINIEKSKINFGLQVTLVPYIKNREKAIELYRNLGVPLKKT